MFESKKPIALFFLTIYFGIACNKHDQKEVIDQTTQERESTDSESPQVPPKTPKNPHDQVDELALDLKQLEEKWPSLDFATHRVRAEGYVTHPHINGDSCIVKMVYYPFDVELLAEKQFDTKVFDIHLEKNYSDRQKCEELNHHRISVLIKDPLKSYAGFVDQEILKDEDAEESFEQFFPELLEGKYPDIQIKELKQDQPLSEYALYKAQIVSFESTTYSCEVTLDAAHLQPVKLYYDSNSHGMRYLSEPVNSGNCASLSGKTMIGYGRQTNDHLSNEAVYIVPE